MYAWAAGSQGKSRWAVVEVEVEKEATSLGARPKAESGEQAAMTLAGPGATMAQMDDLVFESTRTVTQADFAAWAAERRRVGDLGHYELLHGRIVMTPPAGYPHGRIEANVVFALVSFVRGHGGGQVYGSSQGFELPTADTVEPDASFVSSARMAAAPAPERGRFLHVVPDLVVEILSTRTASQDRGEKKAIYEAAGVLEYWLLDERACEILIHSLERGKFGKERVFGPGQRARSELLAGLEVSVDEVFG